MTIGSCGDPVRSDGDLILQISHCGICGSDLHITQTDYLQPGTILGHEFAGTVVESGAGGPAAGTRATALPYRACMQCGDCQAGHYQHCPQLKFIGLGLPGAFADYVAVPLAFVQPLPAGVGFELGAMIEPLAVAHHALALAGPLAGMNVLIMGGGPIGAAVTLFAVSKGARKVMMSEPAAERRSRATQLGATATVDPRTEDPGARFEAHAGGAPDIVFECVGIAGVLAKAVALVRNRGQIVVAGAMIGEDRFHPTLALVKEVCLKFSFSYTVHDFAAVSNALARGEIDPEPMLTDRIALSALPEVFEALRTPSSQCKVLVDMRL